jgi:hypothetical protein
MNIGEVVRELEVLPVDEPRPQVEPKPREPARDDPVAPTNG